MMLVGSEQDLSPETKKIMASAKSAPNDTPGMQAINDQKKKTKKDKAKAMADLMAQMEDVVRNLKLMESEQFPTVDGEEDLSDMSNTAAKQAGDVGMFGENMDVEADDMSSNVPGKTEQMTAPAKDGEELDNELQTDEETGEDTKELKKKLLIATLRTKMKSDV